MGNSSTDVMTDNGAAAVGLLSHFNRWRCRSHA